MKKELCTTTCLFSNSWILGVAVRKDTSGILKALRLWITEFSPENGLGFPEKVSHIVAIYIKVPNTPISHVTIVM
jgi:hypothetical protein